MLIDVGPVQVRVPRDAAGTFEPQIVRKRQRRLSGVDDLVLSLSAKGLTHGEICAHLAEVYGTEVSSLDWAWRFWMVCVTSRHALVPTGTPWVNPSRA